MAAEALSIRLLANFVTNAAVSASSGAILPPRLLSLIAPVVDSAMLSSSHFLGSNTAASVIPGVAGGFNNIVFLPFTCTSLAGDSTDSFWTCAHWFRSTLWWIFLFILLLRLAKELQKKRRPQVVKRSIHLKSLHFCLVRQR